jgi:D-glycero-alpha-D-manno-heptose-7-phosphate kinase
MNALVARAPTRIDFGGGWTDVPPYAQEQGGFVCNVAITRYATVRLTASAPEQASPVDGGDHALADAAFRVARLGGVSARIHNDFPLGAGLGGSSAAGVAMMGAIEAWRAVERAGLSAAPVTALADHDAMRELAGTVPRDRATLAEASRRVEVDELHVAGGRQDHYAAAFGGALGITFGERTLARRLVLPRPTIRALESRCLLAYTGQSRISGTTIRAVLDAYGAREGRVLRALARMKALAEAMADALVAEDLDALGVLVGEHWLHQRALHPAITTPLIDRIIDVATAAGAIGGKALGASGGGCVLLIAARGFEEAVRRAVEELATVLPFAIDHQGFAWWTPGDPQAPQLP